MPPSSSHDFNPQSMDAVLSKILQRVEDHHVELADMRQEIKTWKSEQAEMRGKWRMVAVGVSLGVTLLANLLPMGVAAIVGLFKHK